MTLATTAPAERTYRDLAVRWRRLLMGCAAAWTGVGLWLLIVSRAPDLAIDVDSTFAHGLVFFWIALSVMGLVLTRADGWQRPVLVAAGAVTALAAATELLQLTVVDGRKGSWSDFLADAAGVGVALGLVIGLVAWLSRTRTARWVAVLSTGALVVLVLLLIWSHPAVASWRACVGAATAGPTLVESPPGDLEPGQLGDSRDLVCGLADAETATITVTFTSATVSQEGPARILTSSEGPGEHQVNFHVGQSGTNLSIRMRTDDDRDREWESIPDVIEAGRRHVVELEMSSTTLVVQLDGIVVGRFVYDAIDLSLWDAQYPLIVGDEASGERPFDGVVHSFSVVADPTS